MIFKFIVAIFIIAVSAFVAYRFGFIGERLPIETPTIKTKISPSPFPVNEASGFSSPSTTPSVATTSAKITINEAPKTASASASIAIKWSIESDKKIATASNTAIRYGKVAKPKPKLSSDYPEKSAIQSGPIPATFSATLSIPFAGIYYLRAHAIIDNINIWSEEQTLEILK